MKLANDVKLMLQAKAAQASEKGDTDKKSVDSSLGTLRKWVLSRDT